MLSSVDEVVVADGPDGVVAFAADDPVRVADTVDVVAATASVDVGAAGAVDDDKQFFLGS